MFEPFRIYRGIYGEGLVRVHNAIPREGEQFVIKSIFIPRLKIKDRNEDFQGGATGIVELVEKAQISLAGNGSVLDFHFSPTEFLDFFGEDFFQPKKGFDLYAEVFCIHKIKFYRKSSQFFWLKAILFSVKNKQEKN